RLFARDERPATASVFLHLRPGFQLSASQVRGIAHLIARSVEGLRPADITIGDMRRQVLSALLRSDSVGLVDGAGLATRLELQRAYERELELRAQSMLETVYGPGRAIVRVNAELNFDLEEERQDLFEPVVRNEGVVRSSQIFEEEGRGTGAAAGGITGVDANVPGFVADADAGGSFSRREEILNFELNRIERVRVQAPGRIQRLSVGVWLDAQLEPAEQERVRELVSAALGINEARGDTVIVDGTPFAVSPVAALIADAAEPAPALPVAWIVAAVAGLLLLLILLLVLLRRPAPRPAVDVVVDDELVAVTREETEDERMRKHLRERAADLVRKNPREAAQLAKVWLAEGQWVGGGWQQDRQDGTDWSEEGRDFSHRGGARARGPGVQAPDRARDRAADVRDRQHAPRRTGSHPASAGRVRPNGHRPGVHQHRRHRLRPGGPGEVGGAPAGRRNYRPLVGDHAGAAFRFRAQ